MIIVLILAMLIGLLQAYISISDVRSGKSTGITESKNLFDYFIRN